MKKIININAGIYLVAIGVFVAKLAINSYYKVHGATTASEIARKSEIASFYVSPAYRSRVESDSLQTEIFSGLVAQKSKRNEYSLGQSGTLRHDESIRALGDSIKAISQRRTQWASRQVDAINSRYAAESSGLTVQWGGLGLIYVFEILSLLFGFLAAKRKASVKFTIPALNADISFKPQFWICTAASFYAEYASCQITKAALMLLVANADLAATYSTAFMILSPTLFAIGGLQLEEKEVEPLKPVIIPKVPNVGRLQPKRQEPVVVSSVKKKAARTYEPHENDPKTYEEAVDLYARDIISAVKGRWNQRRIADEFLGDPKKGSLVNVAIDKRRRAIQEELETRKNGHSVEVAA